MGLGIFCSIYTRTFTMEYSILHFFMVTLTSAMAIYDGGWFRVRFYFCNTLYNFLHIGFRPLLYV